MRIYMFMINTNNNSAAYCPPDIEVAEVDIAGIICQSKPTDFDPEIDELP